MWHIRDWTGTEKHTVTRDGYTWVTAAVGGRSRDPRNRGRHKLAGRMCDRTTPGGCTQHQNADWPKAPAGGLEGGTKTGSEDCCSVEERDCRVGAQTRDEQTCATDGP